MSETRLRLVDRLFAPASVAIIGASSVPGKWGHRAAAEVLSEPMGRRIHLVNARGGMLEGHQMLNSVTDLPEAPDLAVVTVPRAAFLAAIDDLLVIGARTILGITAGFGEESAEGAAFQAEAVRRVRAAGGILVGPNCMGVCDTTVPFRCMPWTQIPPGKISFISQSGGLIMDMALRLADHGQGLARVVSVGNAADVSALDLLPGLAAHDGSAVVAVYLEALPGGRMFLDAVAACAAAKPVVVMSPDDTAGARRAAGAHTASLVSTRRALQAAVEAAGGHYASSPAQMAEMLIALASSVRGRGRKVAVISDTGGPVVLMTGAAEREGLSIPRFSAPLAETVAAASSPRAQTQNPVDLVDNLTVETAADVLDRVLASDEVDGALMNLHVFVHETPEAEEQVGRRIAATARRLAKPVVIASRDLQSPGPMAAAQAGVPVFRDGEAAARAMTLLMRPTVMGFVATIPPANAPVPQGPLVARDLLVGGGLRFPDAILAIDAGSAVQAAQALGAPLAVKVVGPLHKTDIGGVRLNLTAAEVEAAAHTLLALPGANGVLVEHMADTTHTVEVLAGVTWELGLGPVLAVGMGGVLAEVQDDVALTLAPASKAEVLAALNRLRGRALLHGFRGKPAVDLDALAQAIALMSRIAAAQPDLAVLEVNPFLVGPDGVVALDARLVRAEEQQ